MDRKRTFCPWSIRLDTRLTQTGMELRTQEDNRMQRREFPDQTNTEANALAKPDQDFTRGSSCIQQMFVECLLYARNSSRA